MINNDFLEYVNEDGTFKPEFYDQDYYENGPQSGKGWLQNYRWLPRRTFKEAFSFIDYLELDENSYVLDVGCAKGFIVRALRELEIPADGCDISSYALSFAPNGCWNCADPKSWDEHAGKYTHVIIKDMLEHLMIHQLYELLNNISKVSNKIMTIIPMGENNLYRIPEYHQEISHLIIENENWWRYQFFKSGWKVVKDTNYVNGLKDNWQRIEDGNHVFYFEYDQKIKDVHI